MLRLNNFRLRYHNIRFILFYITAQSFSTSPLLFLKYSHSYQTSRTAYYNSQTVIQILSLTAELNAKY